MLQMQVMKAALVAAGFMVDTVSSGLNAVRLVQQPGRYDVVLIDYRIPEINGLGIATLVADFMGQAVRPILIAFTATPEQVNAKEKGEKSAFDAVIDKSSDFSLVLTVISRCLASAPDSATWQKAEATLLHQNQLAHDAEPRRSEGRGDDPGPPRILLVENDGSHRELLTSALEHQGYRVDTDSDALGAVRRICDDCYDLALVDYEVPRMDGLAMGALVLDLMDEDLRPRLIALTETPAQPNDNTMIAGDVFDEVLTKSPDLDELMSVVDRHLRSSPNRATRRATALVRPPSQALWA